MKRRCCSTRSREEGRGPACHEWHDSVLDEAAGPLRALHGEREGDHSGRQQHRGEDEERRDGLPERGKAVSQKIARLIASSACVIGRRRRAGDPGYITDGGRAHAGARDAADPNRSADVLKIMTRRGEGGGGIRSREVHGGEARTNRAAGTFALDRSRDGHADGRYTTTRSAEENAKIVERR